jgi:1-deoxy-D-xylulose 5-phosphate reductoisomerase
VGAFLHRRIRFIDIPTIVARTMERYPFMANANFDDIFATDSEARLMAQQILNEL